MVFAAQTAVGRSAKWAECVYSVYCHEHELLGICTNELRCLQNCGPNKKVSERLKMVLHAFAQMFYACRIEWTKRYELTAVGNTPLVHALPEQNFITELHLCNDSIVSQHVRHQVQGHHEHTISHSLRAEYRRVSRFTSLSLSFSWTRTGNSSIKKKNIRETEHRLIIHAKNGV